MPPEWSEAPWGILSDLKPAPGGLSFSPTKGNQLPLTGTSSISSERDWSLMGSMSLSSYVAFCGLCIVLAITPGPDSLLVLRFSLRRITSGFAAAAGSALGNVFWALLVAVGLAALIEQSAEAYRVLKVVGGLYLLYLGIQAIRGRKERSQVEPEGAMGKSSSRVLASFSAGLLSCMLNPKVGLFFLAVVPQFLPKDGSILPMTLLLGGTLATIIMIYLVGLCLVAAKANAWLNRPKVTRNIERTSGAVLGGLGVTTVASAVNA